ARDLRANCERRLQASDGLSRLGAAMGLTPLPSQDDVQGLRNRWRLLHLLDLYREVVPEAARNASYPLLLELDTSGIIRRLLDSPDDAAFSTLFQAAVVLAYTDLQFLKEGRSPRLAEFYRTLTEGGGMDDAALQRVRQAVARLFPLY